MLANPIGGVFPKTKEFLKNVEIPKPLRIAFQTASSIVLTYKNQVRWGQQPVELIRTSGISSKTINFVHSETAQKTKNLFQEEERLNNQRFRDYESYKNLSKDGLDKNSQVYKILTQMRFDEYLKYLSYGIYAKESASRDSLDSQIIRHSFQDNRNLYLSQIPEVSVGREKPVISTIREGIRFEMFLSDIQKQLSRDKVDKIGESKATPEISIKQFIESFESMEIPSESAGFLEKVKIKEQLIEVILELIKCILDSEQAYKTTNLLESYRKLDATLTNISSNPTNKPFMRNSYGQRYLDSPHLLDGDMRAEFTTYKMKNLISLLIQNYGEQDKLEIEEKLNSLKPKIQKIANS